jgi:AmmeMemoRadiSam system protein B
MNEQQKYHPKLRSAIDPTPILHNNTPYILLRDPLNLTNKNCLLPYEYAPLLLLIDGTRTLNGILTILKVHFKISTTIEDLFQIIELFDEAFLLDNDRSQEKQNATLEAYKARDYRKPLLAGNSYPEHPDSLRQALDEYLEKASPPSEKDTDNGSEIRGVISPHIDFGRGERIYAQTWSQAELIAKQAEILLIFGTDHFGESDFLTLTTQNYATPYGVLPTNLSIVEKLTDVLGANRAFEKEIFHMGEHSIELSLVWFHHMRTGAPCDVVPILCGSIPDQKNYSSFYDKKSLEKVVMTLRNAIKGKRALIVASADLSHVGPAFDGKPLDKIGKNNVKAADDLLMERICAADAEGFLQANRQIHDIYNVCGLSPIYMALRLLEPRPGELVAYKQCPADENETSIVSICGIFF